MIRAYQGYFGWWSWFFCSTPFPEEWWGLISSKRTFQWLKYDKKRLNHSANFRVFIDFCLRRSSCFFRPSLSFSFAFPKLVFWSLFERALLVRACKGSFNSLMERGVLGLVWTGLAIPFTMAFSSCYSTMTSSEIYFLAEAVLDCAVFMVSSSILSLLISFSCSSSA